MSASKNFVHPVNLSLFSKNELERFFNQFEVICTDCDGNKKIKNLVSNLRF